MTKEDILDALNEKINEADHSDNFGKGDQLFEVIQTLREIWEMDDEEEDDDIALLHSKLVSPEELVGGMEQVINLTTSYIRPSTFDYLVKQATEGSREGGLLDVSTRRGAVVAKNKKITGVIIGLHSFRDERVDLEASDIPEDLKIVLRAVLKTEANWLVLDENGALADKYPGWDPGLPFYWS